MRACSIISLGCHRLESSEVEEIRFLRHALDAYHSVYENESVENDAKLMFLIGELHRRVGDNKEAVFWFSRVVNDTRIVDASMINASREQWQLLREEMTDAKNG